MTVPTLNEDDIKILLNDNTITVMSIFRGGQKLVAKIKTKDCICLVKFIQISKFFAHEETEDSTFGRLRREINILKSCNCENLVKILSKDLTEKEYKNNHIYYYIEEFIDGSNLQSLLEQKYNFSISEVINFALSINNAIATLWEKSIIHRDIKPQNIIYDISRKKFVLIDPGIAFDLQDVSFTQAGNIVGTATFLSPEQLNPSIRRSLDFRSDHFLLGICMYLLLTKTHPFYFNANSINQVHINIIRYKHFSVLNYRKDIPKGLAQLIDRLLSKEPHMRYRNTKILKDELLNIKNNL